LYSLFTYLLHVVESFLRS